MDVAIAGVSSYTTEQTANITPREPSSVVMAIANVDAIDKPAASLKKTICIAGMLI
jgi:hypothetical protein